jgi:hypothetical protein
MMNHPFISDLSNLTIEELGDKIALINKQLHFYGQRGGHPMINQMMMAKNSYTQEYSKRQDEMFKKQSEKAAKANEKIQIS